MNINKNHRGSITLEAAIVLPIFLMILLALMGLIQRIYIHEKIQYALDETLQQMMVSAYLLEELEITSKLSMSYENALIEEAKFYPYLSGTQTYIEQLSSQEDKMSVFDMSSIGVSVDSQNVFSVANFEQIFSVVNQVIEGVLYLTEDVERLFTNTLKAKGIEILNTYVTAGIVKGLFYDHFDDEALVNLGIKGGMSGLDFTQSSALLDDKYIHIIVSYELGDNVVNPFANVLGGAEHMRQEAHGRAYIGQERKFENLDEKIADVEGEQVYIAASLKGECYHHLECLQIPMTESYYEDERHRSICNVCYKKEGQPRDADTVWFVKGSATAKIHLNAKCYTIYVPAEAILYDEAILRYRPCEKCYGNK